MVHKGSIVILDFGGQYAHLIGNRVRRLGAFSEICEASTKAHKLKNAAGIILSGGPQSVYEKGSPQADPKIFDLGIPILGLCYGHQWIAHALGGEVKPGKTKEYGFADVCLSGRGTGTGSDDDALLFKGLPKEFTVWMSHGDEVVKVPEGFRVIASSQDCAIAAMENAAKRIFGTQFHVEVTHTEHGMEILRRFIETCRPTPWSLRSERAHIAAHVKQEVGDRKVFMLVSGGVDSTVAFTLLNEVLGKDHVQGLLIDTGLMRKNEVREIQQAFEKLGITNLAVEEASEEFFRNLQGVYDPEEKRKVIGKTFLDVQKRVFEKMGLGKELKETKESKESKVKGQKLKVAATEWLLGQGTIYPDTIETGGTKHADQIKTHHNRIEAIQKMADAGLVIEPLKELYKDEVRKLGEELGLPHEFISRHPFPGPGLAVRILCAEREDRLPNQETIRMQSDFYQFRVLPIRSVGVQGDGRSYKHPLAVFMQQPFRDLRSLLGLATSIPNSDPRINRVVLCCSHTKPVTFIVTPSFITRERTALLQEATDIVETEMQRASLMAKLWQLPVVLLPVGIRNGGQSLVLRPVESQEAMTANAAPPPPPVLERLTEKLLRLKGIDMVFLDLTHKPPATIEWE